MPYKDKATQYAAQKAYYEKHKDEIREWRKKWNEAHRAENYERSKKWRQANLDLAQKQDHASYIIRRDKLKTEIFAAYGGPSCLCCGESHIEFLTIDHIGGNGEMQRKQLNRRGGRIYAYLRDNGYPSGYRVLCMNCNLSLGKHGYCPHGDITP